MSASPAASLVVPVYRNAESLPALLEAISGLQASCDGGLEAVFVVDGSPDASAELLRARLPGMPFPAQLIELSRNFGSFAAIREGLRHARGNKIAVIAADLQEPPELVPQFLAQLRSGTVDVVFGERSGRADPWLDRLSAQLYWWLYRKLVQPQMPAGGVDVFAISAEVRDSLLRLESRHTSLVGQLVWLGYRRGAVPYQRRARAHGRSAWTLAKKLDYLLDSLFAFTDFPLRALIAVGALGMVCSLVVGALVFGTWAAGAISVPGYTPIVLLLLFFAALNLFGLGVIGSYAFRAFEAAKQRPGAVVMHHQQYGLSP